MRTNTQSVKPIMNTDLFPQERKRLLEPFSECEAEDWEKPTICPEWTVKYIGLQGDDIGYLSRTRDSFSNPFFQNKTCINGPFFKDVALQPIAAVTMDQETCWRLFTRGMNKNQAKAQTTIEVDQTLGENLLETVSIIA